MWFNEKNATKKLARNSHKGMKKMNETVKCYYLLIYVVVLSKSLPI